MPPTIEELRTKYTELKGQAVGLRDKAKAENRDLSEEEFTQTKAWLNEGEKVTKSIEAFEKAIQDRNAQDARLSAFEKFGDQPQAALTAPVNPNPPADGTTDPHERLSNPNIRITGGPDSLKFDTFGEMLLAVRHAERSPRPDRRLRSANPLAPQAAEASGLNETIPSEGGFLVQQETMSELFQRAYENAAILNRIRTIGLGQPFNGLKINGIDETSRATGSRWGGVRGYWKAEAETVTASMPKFRQVELNLHDLMALYYATDEVLADTAALGSVVSQAISSEMEFLLEDSIINGSGAGQSLGILNAGCVVSIATETGQASNSVVYENLTKMWARMWSRSWINSVWLINQMLLPQLMTMTLDVGTGGLPVYLPPGGASASPYGMIFGRPVIPVEYCAAAGTAGDIILADFSQYVAIDKGGLQSAGSMHVRFIYGEMTYRFTFRFDGQPLWNSALTPYKGTAETLSPFVVLSATGR